jgi:endonuclease YncB( thermonuclease family)
MPPPEVFSGRPEERARGKAAGDFFTHLLPQGIRCRQATQRDTTTFGRDVADIELKDGGDVTTVLVEAGHVIPMEAS